MTAITTLAKAALAGASLALAAGAASAATVTFTGGTGGNGPGETDYANFQTSFGNQSNASNSGIYAGSVAGVAAAPAFGDQGDPFYAVLGGGGVTFTFASAIDVLNFDLGSADDYNSVTIFFAGGGSQTFTGAQLNPPGPATGNQNIAATNGRVRINSYGQAFTSARFTSTGNSFEFDNLATGAVPEPGTWAMMILGFGAIGGALRRKSRVTFATRAALA
ncbi:PEPxxWA-CTERM sorting domain-containing protein [Qipengyuania sediminis]|uniref:PEPxxWA-CTERM sorting domain-containing protein n=1 Tax=Qipengyuania sediminis TaxID=1532023 RepID=UPI001059C8B3|nr:PEPxxWA-CTERM sorting domain-containing protein [Qipengyuania sediminis]